MGRKGRRRGNAGSLSRVLSGLILAMILSSATACPTTDLVEPAQTEIEQILAAIQNYMAYSPAPWPEAWQREYLHTIRAVINAHRDASEYSRRLQILRDGFGPCWEELTKNKDRSHFEVRRAQIHWYVENLMEADLPGEEERQTLRHQYEELADHAAQSLLAQFPFLDPNIVQKAKADHLAECYRNIDAPLLPIFLTPLSEAHVSQVRQRWHDLRYARVDLWRSLGGRRVVETQDVASPRGVYAKASTEHPDYLLAQWSLDQLRGQIWSLTSGPPDYYRHAVANEIAAGKQRLQAEAEARSQERRLGVAAWQTEYLSFLLMALLETADCFEEWQAP